LCPPCHSNAATCRLPQENGRPDDTRPRITRRPQLGGMDRSVMNWLELTLALLLVVCSLDLKAEILKGYPCIRRLNQLYCPTPGNSYPKERIDMFIDENKALIRRMFGEYSSPDDDSAHRDHYETY
ncbi:hypothetical protein HPB47_005826, partial [Ixodes persulcatus]